MSHWIRTLGALAASATLALAQSDSERLAEELRQGLATGALSPADARAALDELGEHDAGRADLAKAVYAGARELAQSLAADPARAGECRELLLLAHECTAITENWTHRALRVYELAPHLVASGERERLFALLEDALERLPENHALAGRLHALLGQLASYRREWDRALAELAAAEAAVARDQQPDVFRAQLCGLRGDTYLQMGLNDLARRWILAERDAVRALGQADPFLLAGLDVHLANLRLASEDWVTLVSEVDAALAARPDADAQTRAELFVRQGIALAALERADPARPRRAEAVLEGVLALGAAASDHELLSARTRLVELTLEQGRHAEAGKRLGDPALADPAARARASPLDEGYRAALAARWARRSGQPADVAAEAQAALAAAYERVHAEWAALELRPGGIGFLKTERVRLVLCERIEGVLGPAPDAQAREAALEVLLRAESISSLARRLTPNVSSGASVEALRRELLGPEEGLLVYLPSRWGTHAFALDRAGIVHARLASDEGFAAARRRLVGAVQLAPAGLSDAERARRRTELVESARALSAALLPPELAGRVAGWRGVTLVADLLGYLPFECLGLERGEPLGLTHALGYLPSCTLGLALARRGRHAPASGARATLVVAAPEHDPELPAAYRELAPLQFTDAERAQLLAAHAPEEVTLLAGPDASFERLREHLDGAALLHVLVHGVQDPERERPAGLLLAPARGADGASDLGLVWIERVETLERIPDVVLATACGAGRGPERSGDAGVSDLGGAFLLGGASVVVLPQADVPYAATLELSGFLHAGLLAGEGTAEALRGARARVSADPRYADPRDWALLHARGLTSFVPFPRAAEAARERAAPGPAESGGGTRVTLLVAAGALGVLALGWVLRRGGKARLERS